MLFDACTISSYEINLGFYFTHSLQTTKADLRFTLLAKQSHYISALERSHVVLLEVQIPKAKPEGFQNSSTHITETSTGALLVMNYTGFQNQFDLSIHCLEKLQKVWNERYLTITIFVLYCLLLIIKWEIHGSEFCTSKSSLSFSIQMQLFQTRLSKFHMVLTEVRKPELGFE